MAPVDVISVEVAYGAAPGQLDLTALSLEAGATVADALRVSGVLQRHALSESDLGARLRVGVWGREQPLTTLLRERDRVELYRPLQVDPKEARRLRYKQHRERASSGDQAPRAPEG